MVGIVAKGKKEVKKVDKYKKYGLPGGRIPDPPIADEGKQVRNDMVRITPSPSHLWSAAAEHIKDHKQSG
jgi:hypothetical protein